jgi:hypothetical protein
MMLGAVLASIRLHRWFAKWHPILADVVLFCHVFIELDPIRFHSFDVIPYQSGRSQYVTVVLYHSTLNVKTSVL